MVKISRQWNYHMAQQFDNAINIDTPEAVAFIKEHFQDDYELGPLHMDTDHLTDGEYYYDLSIWGKDDRTLLGLTTAHPSECTYQIIASRPVEQENITGVKKAIAQLRVVLEHHKNIKEQATIIVSEIMSQP